MVLVKTKPASLQRPPANSQAAGRTVNIRTLGLTNHHFDERRQTLVIPDTGSTGIRQTCTKFNVNGEINYPTGL